MSDTEKMKKVVRELPVWPQYKMLGPFYTPEKKIWLEIASAVRVQDMQGNWWLALVDSRLEFDGTLQNEHTVASWIGHFNMNCWLMKMAGMPNPTLISDEHGCYVFVLDKDQRSDKEIIMDSAMKGFKS